MIEPGPLQDSPSRIGLGDIANIVQYICPPSALHRVPAHLLSRPLLQRHHFLSISPDDPPAYLTWPGSDDSQRVLALLEDIRPEDLPELLSAHHATESQPIRYAADPEAVYAHIRITPTPLLQSPHPDTLPSLRLIFLWDQPSNSWNYHNSAIGDFPKHAHADLSHAMALFHSPDDFLPERTYSFNVDNLDDDDDDYWNAYGAGQQPLQPASIKPVSGADTEDAYWAQYSSVQGQCAFEYSPDPSTNLPHSPGSADSTIPSPKPRHRQLQPLEGDQRIFVPSTELNPDIPHSDVYNPLVPPSPSTLSRRLAALPARPDSPPLQEDDVPSSASASAISPSPQLPHAELAKAEETLTIPSIPVNRDENERTGLAAAECISADEALKCTIRGLYQLWRSGEKSQQDFMALVQQAIADQS